MDFYETANKYRMFAIRLRECREKLKLSYDELACQALTTPTSIRQYENEMYMPNSIGLCRLCDVLETTPNYLLGYDGEDKCS